MEFIVKKDISKQLNKLYKKYNNILDDFNNFKINFDINNWKHLWKWIYKFRIKNSSIPVWKSWWFRIILFIQILENEALPFIIYSKTDIENISLKEIIIELKKYI